MARTGQAREEEHYAEAMAILEGRKNGWALPRLRALASRRYGPAMVVLADEEDRPGKSSVPGSAEWLYYRAFRQGAPLAARNFAVHHLNRGDLQGYRHWLVKAARSGDEAAAQELRRFATRFPYDMMRRWGRLRPWRNDD